MALALVNYLCSISLISVFINLFYRNISQSESMIGVFISRERFTRSNNYIEITASTEKISESKSGCLIGCLYDVLYSERNPMDSTSDVGGMVDG